MEKVTEKIAESNYVLIPKMALYGFIGTIVVAVVASWITLRVDIAKMETKIVVIETVINKEVTDINKTNEKLEKIHNDLTEIKGILNLKQDKKWVE